MPPDAATTLAFLISAGAAMADSGYAVNAMTAALTDIASANGLPATQVVALPTALMVSTPAGPDQQTRVVPSGSRPLRLDQIEALSELLDEARLGLVSTRVGLERLTAIRALSPPFSRPQTVGGYVLMAAGLGTLLGGGWLDLAVGAALGAGVGALLLLREQMKPDYQVLVTVAASFTVAVVVFLLAHTWTQLSVLPAVGAPLVAFLPGALLTTAVIELSTGQMIAGAGRLTAGAMQLVLLAVGILAAAALVGVPAIDLDTAGRPLGPLAPWAGVAVFGIGVVVNRSARLASLGWILLVLYVAYSAQVVSGVLLGGVLSAFVGAFLMTPVASVVANQKSGPPTLVSFLPAFWLLVPGALGLIGVTNLFGGTEDGAHTLVTTASTMVAIALGVLCGLGLASLVTRHRSDAVPTSIAG